MSLNLAPVGNEPGRNQYAFGINSQCSVLIDYRYVSSQEVRQCLEEVAILPSYIVHPQISSVDLRIRQDDLLCPSPVDRTHAYDYFRIL